jgi:hypothetical protein
VLAEQTIDELTCLLDEAPVLKVPINNLLDRYEKLGVKLMN